MGIIKGLQKIGQKMDAEIENFEVEKSKVEPPTQSGYIATGYIRFEGKTAMLNNQTFNDILEHFADQKVTISIVRADDPPQNLEA